MLGKINIRRTLILLGVFSVGLFVGHKMTLSTSGNTLDKVTPTFDKAIDKNTIENNINNDFDIGKIKKSDSLQDSSDLIVDRPDPSIVDRLHKRG